MLFYPWICLNLSDPGKPGRKCYMLIDANGIPLIPQRKVTNVRDSRMLEAVMDAVLPIQQC